LLWCAPSRFSRRAAPGTPRSCCSPRRRANPTQTRASCFRGRWRSSAPAATNAPAACWPGGHGSRSTTTESPWRCWARLKPGWDCSSRRRPILPLRASGREGPSLHCGECVPDSRGSSSESGTRRPARLQRRATRGWRASTPGFACVKHASCAIPRERRASLPTFRRRRLEAPLQPGGRHCLRRGTQTPRLIGSRKPGGRWTRRAWHCTAVIQHGPGTLCTD
jgi:hypothetical protein